jgi:hypothetical protein
VLAQRCRGTAGAGGKNLGRGLLQPARFRPAGSGRPGWFGTADLDCCGGLGRSGLGDPLDDFRVFLQAATTQISISVGKKFAGVALRGMGLQPTSGGINSGLGTKPVSPSRQRIRVCLQDEIRIDDPNFGLRAKFWVCWETSCPGFGN